jgi:hypothetical protein
MQALPQDIAATVAEEDRAAAARFVPASEARCLNLMAQNAELRQQLEDATSLTYSYARLIGEHREPQGIVSLIRRLDSQRLKPDELRAILAALYMKADDMPYDMSLVADRLQEAHDACQHVRDLPSDREIAADERQDTLRCERRDGVR